jgi:hypothetical protein
LKVGLKKHGDKAVFLGRMVPVMREMISVPAGLIKNENFKVCSVYICRFLCVVYRNNFVWILF